MNMEINNMKAIRVEKTLKIIGNTYGYLFILFMLLRDLFKINEEVKNYIIYPVFLFVGLILLGYKFYASKKYSFPFIKTWQIIGWGLILIVALILMIHNYFW